MKGFGVLIAVTLKAMLGFSLPTLADTSPEWGTAGGWTIAVDQTIGNACFIIAEYEGSTVLRLGFNPSDRNAYILISNDNWESIEVGKDYLIEIEFDTAGPWEVSASGWSLAGQDQGGILLAMFDNTDFIKEFVRKHEMIIRYQGQEIERLTLKGSRAAVSEMIRCQEAMNNYNGSRPANNNRDPFSSGGSDPFR